MRLSEQNHLQDCLHEPHDAHRRRIIAALDDGYTTPQRRAARHMAQCSSAARFYIDPARGKVHPWLNRCRHKMCPFCGRARSAHVAAQLTSLMVGMKHPRQIILTVRSIEEPLRGQNQAIRRWFRQLRRTPEWKQRVTGGAYTLEITTNEKTHLWHPHLHIVYDGEYFPQRLLRRLWHKITDGSEVVWVQDVRDAPGAARELAKYIGKVQQIDRLQDRQIREYADAVSGARMVQTFGNCHGNRVADEDPAEPNSPDTYTVTIARLVYLANLGAPAAQHILPLIAARWPTFASYIAHAIPQLEPEISIHRRQAAARARIAGGTLPNRGPPEAQPKAEQLDAAIFVDFTRIRVDQDAGTHDTLEAERYVRAR